MERSPHGIASMSSFVGQFEKGTLDPTHPATDKIRTGLQLEFAVRAGKYPEQLQHWLNKISKATGVLYKVKAKEEPEDADLDEIAKTMVPQPATPEEAPKGNAPEVKTIDTCEFGDFLRKVSGTSVALQYNYNRVKVLGRVGAMIWISNTYDDRNYQQTTVGQLKGDGFEVEA